MEGWKHINGLDYQVSNYGRVRNLRKHILKPSVINAGYLQTTLTKDKKTHKKLVHRLVAETFLKCDDTSLVVDHIDNNKLNNHVSNLQFISQRENTNKSTPIGISGFRGVERLGKNWRARISLNGERVELGTFKDKISAAEAYEIALSEHLTKKII